MIQLMLCFILAFFLADADPYFQETDKFLVLADAGSTGTRFFLYEKHGSDVVPVVWPGQTPPPGKKKKKVEFAPFPPNWPEDNSDCNKGWTMANWEAGEMNKYWGCLQIAMKAVLAGKKPEIAAWGYTVAPGPGPDLVSLIFNDLLKLRWVVHATAGMRTVKDEKKCFDKLKEAMEGDIHDGRAVEVGTISGALEGIYEALSALEILKGTPRKDYKKVIHVSMGGASVQITFAVPCSPPAETFPPNRRLLRLKKQIDDVGALQPGVFREQGDDLFFSFLETEAEEHARTSGYVKYSGPGAEEHAVCLYSESFMGYGKHFLQAFVSTFGSAKRGKEKKNAEKCFPSSFQIESKKIGDKFVVTTSADDGTGFKPRSQYDGKISRGLIANTNPSLEWRLGGDHINQYAYLLLTRLGAPPGRLAGFPDDDKVDGDIVACTSRIKACKDAIKSVTIGPGSGKEYRGTGDDGEIYGVEFAERWKRLQDALAKTKESDFAKEAIIWKQDTVPDDPDPFITDVRRSIFSDGCRLNALTQSNFKSQIGPITQPAFLLLVEEQLKDQMVLTDGKVKILAFETSKGEWTDSDAFFLFHPNTRIFPIPSDPSAVQPPAGFADSVKKWKFDYQVHPSAGAGPEPELTPFEIRVS